MRTVKINMTLKEAAMAEYRINQELLEKKSGLPSGTIAQYLHDRKASIERLKALTKGFRP